MCENGPEKVEKKYTVAHSTPDVTLRKKKSSIRPGYYMRGLPVDLKFFFKFRFFLELNIVFDNYIGI